MLRREKEGPKGKVVSAAPAPTQSAPAPARRTIPGLPPQSDNTKQSKGNKNQQSMLI